MDNISAKFSVELLGHVNKALKSWSGTNRLKALGNAPMAYKDYRSSDGVLERRGGTLGNYMLRMCGNEKFQEVN